MAKLSQGVVHEVPDDFGAVLTSTREVYNQWEDITPLARNEWICWIESAKKQETREKRLQVAKEQLSQGKRRPCCWPGCKHR